MAVSYLKTLQSLEMRMPADDYMGYIPSSWTALSCLHSLTLNYCREIPPTLSRLAGLRSLTVSLLPEVNAQVDFEGLTQLTQLHISFTKPQISSRANVLLPKGDSVQMRHVTLFHAGLTENLQYATQLMCLNTIQPAVYLSRTHWRNSLPQLKSINICKNRSSAVYLELSCPLPDVWQNYTSLNRLTLYGLAIDFIPDWIVKLQKLKRLDLPSARLKDLNITALLQLPALEELDIGVCSSDVLSNVVHCAQLPSLRRFAYGCCACGTEHQDKLAQSAILCLQSAFEVHDRGPFSTQSWILETYPKLRFVQFKSCHIE